MKTLTTKCSHGILLFEKDARCIDCEIKWENMVIEQAMESLTKAKKRLTLLEKEKSRCS